MTNPFDQWYNMSLGQSFHLADTIKVWRVPGGWLVQSQGRVCFIPYSDEFVSK